MASQVAFIKAFVKSLTQISSQTGINATDTALKAIGLPGYTSLLNTFNQWYANSSSTKWFLSQCDINLDNSDTGAITGSDAGGSKTKTAESIIPESTSAKELTESEYSSFTKNGLTVNIIYDNYNDLAKQRLIVKKLYNWWIPEALDLIDESLGVNFYDGRASTNALTISFNNYSSAFLTCNMNFNSQGRPSDISVSINTNYLNVTENDKNGNIISSSSEIEAILNGTSFYYYDDGKNYFDSFLANSLAAATLMANINYYYFLPLPIYLGLINIVNGADDTISKALNDYGSDNVNLYDVDMGYYGYAFMRCLAKNYAENFKTPNNDTDDNNNSKSISNNKSNFTLTGTTGNDTLTNTGYNVLINGNAGNDFISNGADFVTINSSAGNDSVVNFNADVIINGDDGADVILNNEYGYDVKINGGNGNDLITNNSNYVTVNAGTGEDHVFNFGDQSIINLDEGNDTINNNGERVTLNCGDGNDTVLNVTESLTGNYILINGEAGNDFIGSNGHSATINGGTGNDSIKNVGS